MGVCVCGCVCVRACVRACECAYMRACVCIVYYKSMSYIIMICVVASINKLYLDVNSYDTDITGNWHTRQYLATLAVIPPSHRRRGTTAVLVRHKPQ